MDKPTVDTKAIGERVLAIFDQYRDARESGNTAVLQKLIGEDYMHFHGKGRIDNKSSLIADIKTGRVKQLKRETSDLKVRVFGATTAIVTGRGHNQIVMEGVPGQNELLFTAVWVRSSGDADDWQIVSWQSCHLEKKG